MIAVGVAKPSAQGHAIIRTAMEIVNAKIKWPIGIERKPGATKYQKRKDKIN